MAARFAPGADPVETRREPGGDLDGPGAAPGSNRMQTGSQPGLCRVCAGCLTASPNARFRRSVPVTLSGDPPGGKSPPHPGVTGPPHPLYPPLPRMPKAPVPCTVRDAHGPVDHSRDKAASAHTLCSGRPVSGFRSNAGLRQRTQGAGSPTEACRQSRSRPGSCAGSCGAFTSTSFERSGEYFPDASGRRVPPLREAGCEVPRRPHKPLGVKGCALPNWRSLGATTGRQLALSGAPFLAPTERAQGAQVGAHSWRQQSALRAPEGAPFLALPERGTDG